MAHRKFTRQEALEGLKVIVGNPELAECSTLSFREYTMIKHWAGRFNKKLSRPQDPYAVPMSDVLGQLGL